MKIVHVLTAAICAAAVSLLAQSATSTPAQSQYLLIVRSKVDSQPTSDQVQTNIKHWQEFMGNLAKSGELAGGYRPGNDGMTLSGTHQTEKSGSYVANGEVVSSFLIINATDLRQAKEIAAKCPVFELAGSVEIRPMQNTAH